MVMSLNHVLAAGDGDTEWIQEYFATGTRDPDEISEGMDLGDDFDPGCTLLYSAAEGGHCETMRVILAHGASVDAIDERGRAALHGAALSGHHNAVVLLFDNGAQINVSDEANRSPLTYASFGGHRDVIRLLLHRGMDLDARDFDGSNAEDVARGYGNVGAARLLAEVRRAGGWRGYVRYPRFRLLMLRILAEQGRAKRRFDGFLECALYQRLFPQYPMALECTPVGEKYTAQKGGRLPRAVFWHIAGYWRSDRDYAAPSTRSPSLVPVGSLWESQRNLRLDPIH